MLLKPSAGLKVRHNITRQLLPDEGVEVPDTDGMPHDPYWQFLLRHGDVTSEADHPFKAPAEPAATEEQHEADAPADSDKH